VSAPRIAALALALAACGQSSPPAPTCTPSWYRVDAVTLPTHIGDAMRYGLDLDGDGNFDNAFAYVLSATLSGNPDIGDVSALATARLGRGDPTWRIAVETCDDGVPRFALSEASQPFEVSVTAGRITGGGAAAEVPITVLADPLGTFEPIAWLPVVGGAVALDTSSGALDGVIGFAMPMPASQQDLLAPFAAYLTGELRAGRSPFATACDQNHDGVCTVDELLTAPNIGSGSLTAILVEPDVRIDGVDALSAGIGIHATPEP
jgi:hypothetical protein